MATATAQRRRWPTPGATGARTRPRASRGARGMKSSMKRVQSPRRRRRRPSPWPRRRVQLRPSTCWATCSTCGMRSRTRSPALRRAPWRPWTCLATCSRSTRRRSTWILSAPRARRRPGSQRCRLLAMGRRRRRQGPGSHASAAADGVGRHGRDGRGAGAAGSSLLRACSWRVAQVVIVVPAGALANWSLRSQNSGRLQAPWAPRRRSRAPAPRRWTTRSIILGS
mmetsp:Transcript_78636/g.212888  ORF Transcript_78636/g.212888 Transcript_78636/m.212888 type:complete len:225 (+) Transcript_78636:370-1044(+)